MLLVQHSKKKELKHKKADYYELNHPLNVPITKTETDKMPKMEAG